MSKSKNVVVDGVNYIAESELKIPAQENEGMPYVIVRTYSSGVFAGYLSSKSEPKDGYVSVILKNARRIWMWQGAASLSQLATSGTSKPQDCKFPEEVIEVELTNAIEILKCTEESKISIINVPIWKQ